MVNNIGEPIAVHSHTMEYRWYTGEMCSVPCHAYWNDRLGEVSTGQAETEFEQRYPGTGGLLQHPMWDNEEDDYRFNVGMDNHREQLILASG